MISSRALVVAVLLACATLTVAAQSSVNYKAPRTPWGDPDLQGNYTNLSEAGTPMERPAEYVGKNMNEFSREELANIKKTLAARTINAFLGPTEAPDNWWQPAYGQFVERGSQLWFVTDPADGRIPPLTPEAQQRRAAAAPGHRDPAHKRDHPHWVTDLNLYDPRLTPRYPNSLLPANYGKPYENVPGPGAGA